MTPGRFPQDASGDEPDRRLDVIAAEMADAENLAEVIEAARRAGRERVVELLADAYAEEVIGRLVERRVDEVLDAEQPVVGPRVEEVTVEDMAVEDVAVEDVSVERPERDDSSLGFYVYGVIGEGDWHPEPGLAGVDPEHDVEVIGDGGIQAVVSRVRLSEFDEEPLRERLNDMRWLERTARTHEQVLEEVLGSCTPIPMRICSVYRDPEGLRAMLERDHGVLRHGLEDLRGAQEWGVKAFAVGVPPSDGDDVRTDPGSSAESSASGGARYLEERLRERRRRDHEVAVLDEACARLHAELSTAAGDARTLPPQRPEISGRSAEMVLNATYLVHESERADFLAAVGRAQEASESGLEIELTGPWPPYNFVPAAIGGSV